MSATHKNPDWSDGTPIAGQQFEYTFDDIGNRKTTTRDTRSATYTPNTLNQYTSREVPGYVSVLGSAKTNATVSLWSTNSTSLYATTTRKGEYFRGELPLNNNTGAVWLTITNLAVLNNGSNPDIVTNTIGQTFVPKTAENFYYDLDGNLTNDGRWTYTWDAENRLVRMVASTTTGPQQRLDFEFDSKGRRIAKKVWNNTAGTGSPALEQKFVYDGWNLIAILAPNSSILSSFVWGLDLSGTPQGAGGVGGLLLTRNVELATTNFVACDGNGNVSALVNTTNGAVSANYEYGPFGEPLRITGAIAKANPFRFSTKYQDDENDMLYYGYRSYNPRVGKWLNRDPLGEKLAKNLYGFVNNDSVNAYDYLGLMTVSSCQKTVDNIMADPGKHSKNLKAVMDGINKIKGCKPLKPVCSCTGNCADKDWVGYVSGDSLIICANRQKGTALLLETLVHENLHVLQKCRKQDQDSCDGAVCTEIQAALNDGTCQRLFPNDVRNCVINTATAAAENRCGSRENARQRVEVLYDSCNLGIGEIPKP